MVRKAPHTLNPERRKFHAITAGRARIASLFQRGGERARGERGERGEREGREGSEGREEVVGKGGEERRRQGIREVRLVVYVFGA
jgi:hypothetical protein